VRFGRSSTTQPEIFFGQQRCHWCQDRLAENGPHQKLRTRSVTSKARESWHHPSRYAVAFALWAGLLTLILWSVALLVHVLLPHSLTTAEGNGCRPGGEKTIPQTKSSVTLSSRAFSPLMARSMCVSSSRRAGSLALNHRIYTRNSLRMSDEDQSGPLKLWTFFEHSFLLQKHLFGCRAKTISKTSGPLCDFTP
jgi:hypothetical protein